MSASSRLCLSAICLGSLVACGQSSTENPPASQDNGPVELPEGLETLWGQSQETADKVLGKPIAVEKLTDNVTNVTYQANLLSSVFPSNKVEGFFLTFYNSKLTAASIGLDYDQVSSQASSTSLTPEKEKARLERVVQLSKVFFPAETSEAKLLSETDFIENLGVTKTFCLNKRVSSDISPGLVSQINLVNNVDCESLY